MKLRTKIIIPKLVLIGTLILAFSIFFIYLKNNEKLLNKNQADAEKLINYTNALKVIHERIDNNVLKYSISFDRKVYHSIMADVNTIKSLNASMLSLPLQPIESDIVNKYTTRIASYEAVLKEMEQLLISSNGRQLATVLTEWGIHNELITAALNDVISYSTRLLEVSHRTYDGVIHGVVNMAWVILSISVGLTIINLYYLNYSITTRLGILAQAANEISKGNFVAVNLPGRSNDEIGVLAKDINEMAEKLRESYTNLEIEVEKKNRELIAQNKELERSNKELEDFAYVASHDLQEPLRKIQAFTDLLGEEYKNKLDATGLDYMNRMKNAASRMSKLISDLLIFSRVTTKAQPFSRVDLNEITKDVINDLDARILQTKAKITVEKLPVIDADPLQIRQMVQNLLSNAIKFQKKGTAPVIRIYSNKDALGDDACYDIYFEDNGIGIEKKYFDKIFTVFQRLHTREEYEGTGVGLAVVKKIVDRHKGSIKIRSEVGKGTTFMVTLPEQH